MNSKSAVCFFAIAWLTSATAPGLTLVGVPADLTLRCDTLSRLRLVLLTPVPAPPMKSPCRCWSAASPFHPTPMASPSSATAPSMSRMTRTWCARTRRPVPCCSPGDRWVPPREHSIARRNSPSMPPTAFMSPIATITGCRCLIRTVRWCARGAGTARPPENSIWSTAWE